MTGGVAMAWQAVDDFHFALATGAGPESVPDRAGPSGPARPSLTAAASLFSTLAPPTPGHVDGRAVGHGRLGRDRVVVPNPGPLVPHQDRAASTAWALGMFTLAVGRVPVRQDGAWVWDGVREPSPPLAIPTGAFTACTSPGRRGRPDRVGDTRLRRRGGPGPAEPPDVAPGARRDRAWRPRAGRRRRRASATATAATRTRVAARLIIQPCVEAGRVVGEHDVVGAGRHGDAAEEVVDPVDRHRAPVDRRLPARVVGVGQDQFGGGAPRGR